MGLRKKNNKLQKIKNEAAKITRDRSKVKRAKKQKTDGQKLHDLMHGRK